MSDDLNESVRRSSRIRGRPSTAKADLNESTKDKRSKKHSEKSCKQCGYEMDENDDRSQCSECASDDSFNPKEDKEDDDDSNDNSDFDNDILNESVAKEYDSNEEEVDELAPCSKCNSLVLNIENKMMACVLCNRHFHINCLLPEDLPEDLKFDTDGYFTKKLGCLVCQAPNFPFKINEILFWKWRKEAESKDNPTDFYCPREFFVQYKTRSYWDCEWVNEIQLDQYEQFLLRSYKRKFDNLVELPLPAHKKLQPHPSGSPNKRKSQVNCDMDELYDKYFKWGINPQWLRPHRVVDLNNKSITVKWRERGYEYVSVEPVSRINEIPELSDLVTFYKKTIHELSDGSKLKKKTEIKKINKSPVYLGPPNQKAENRATLHDYQMEGLNWLRSCYAQNINTILADEMGLGKTIQVIALLYSLYKDNICRGPFLLTVPLSTLKNWEREFEFWAPDFSLVYYTGDKEARAFIREKDIFQKSGSKTLKFHVLLTSYELINLDTSFFSKIDWEVLVIDEAHRLKNSDSRLFKILKKMNIKYRLLMTGTPLQNNMEELFTLLNFMEPSSFNDLSAFLSKFHDISQEEHVQKLQDMLKKHLLRRLKSDVFSQLPAKEEQIIRVDLTPEQKSTYKLLLAKNYKELTSKYKNSGVSLNNVMMQLRKLCNHPFLIPERRSEYASTDWSLCPEKLIAGTNKLLILKKMIDKLIPDNHKILIFSGMTRMLNLIEDLLDSMDLCYERLDGNKKSLLRQEAIDNFNDPQSDSKIFLLSTKAGGLGINLVSADTVFIYDSDWNPHNDIQALSRAHRLGQQRKVMIYRFVTRNSVEEKIMEVAKRKMMLTSLVVERYSKTEFHQIISFGTKELFEESGEKDEQKIIYDDAAIDKLLDRNRPPDANDTPNEILDACFSGFKVAQYEFEETTEENTEQEEVVKYQEDLKKLMDGDKDVQAQLAVSSSVDNTSVILPEESKRLRQSRQMAIAKNKMLVETTTKVKKTLNLTIDVSSSDDDENYDEKDDEYKLDADDLMDADDEYNVGQEFTLTQPTKSSNVFVFPTYNDKGAGGAAILSPSSTTNVRQNPFEGDLALIAQYGQTEGIFQKLGGGFNRTNVQLEYFHIVHGFFPVERMEVYKTILNRGAPPKLLKKGDIWWPKYLQYKSQEVMDLFINWLMINLIDYKATGDSLCFRDGVKKDDVNYDLMLSRIGLMSLIHHKANIYEMDNERLLEYINNHPIEPSKITRGRIEQFNYDLENMEFVMKIFDGGFSDIQSIWKDEDLMISKSSNVTKPNSCISTSISTKPSINLDPASNSESLNEIPSTSGTSISDLVKSVINEKLNSEELSLQKSDLKDQVTIDISKEDDPVVESSFIDKMEVEPSKNPLISTDIATSTAVTTDITLNQSNPKQSTPIMEFNCANKAGVWNKLHDYILLVAISEYGYDEFLDYIFQDPHYQILFMPYLYCNLNITNNAKQIRSSILSRLNVLERALLLEAQMMKLSVVLDSQFNGDRVSYDRFEYYHKMFNTQTDPVRTVRLSSVNSIFKAKVLAQLEVLINDIGKKSQTYRPILLRKKS